MAVESCQRGFYSDSDDNTMTTTGRREEAHTPNKKEKYRENDSTWVHKIYKYRKITYFVVPQIYELKQTSVPHHRDFDHCILYLFLLEALTDLSGMFLNI